jgi:hypothetical protein
MSRTRILAAALPVLAALTVAGSGSWAQDAGRGGGSTQTDAPSPEPDPRSDDPGRSQMLSDAELGQIAAILRRSSPPAFEVGVDEMRPGTVVPRKQYAFKPVPAEVIAIAPGYRDYGFAVLDGTLAVVDPQTLVVIAVLP